MLMDDLVPDLPKSLRHQLDSGRCYLQGQAAAELNATAQAMVRALQRTRMRGDRLSLFMGCEASLRHLGAGAIAQTDRNL
jgi:hypothetical protein